MKEVYAGLQTIKSVCDLASGEAATLTLLIDNTACMHSFDKWYSKNREARYMLRRAYKMCHEKNITLIVKYVKSEDNAADRVSRFLEIDDNSLVPFDDLCRKCVALSKDLFAYPHDPSLDRRSWMKERNADTPLNDDPMSEDDLDTAADFWYDVESCDPEHIVSPSAMMQEDWLP